MNDNMKKLIPGNYPGEYDIKECRVSGPPESEYVHKIIVAADMRRYTETMEELRVQMDIKEFLSDFFDESAQIIRQYGGLMNKYLGDGFFAHFLVKEPQNLPQIVENAIEAVFYIHSIFPQLKENYGFEKLGLSVVLSIESQLIRGKIGRIEYTDYSMIGRSVNSLFRAIDMAKGKLVLLYDPERRLVEFLNKKWILIDLGTQTCDALIRPIRLYSVMRKKMHDENDRTVRKCTDRCDLYFLCYKAWDQGKNKQRMINCQFCGQDPSYQCWHWKECKVKQNYGIAHPSYTDFYGKDHHSHEKFECCHVCEKFTRCFHSYFLGKIDYPMIWCGSHFPWQLVKIRLL